MKCIRRNMDRYKWNWQSNNNLCNLELATKHIFCL